MDVYNQYQTPGCQAFVKRPKNAIYINVANSKEHEHAKLDVCYDLHKEGKTFITEAVNKRTGYRHDVICIDDGTIYELETTAKRAERFLDVQKSYDVDIIVKELWKEPSFKVNFNLLKKACEAGHCLCDMGNKCPCDDFLKKQVCKCGVFKRE
jgi:hypothetical protein